MPVGLAAEERRDLCGLFERVGPHAPTLCAGWTTRDLAAHLVLRERRPDAAAGVLLPVLRRWTAKVQERVAQRPFAELVEQVRGGPPRWSPYALPSLELIGLLEYFVHHEDVRRAQPGWSPRRGEPRREAALWKILRPAARRGYRSSTVGVTLRRPDGVEDVVRRGPRQVTLTGAPGELLMHALGRDEVVVDFAGTPTDVATVQSTTRGI